MGNDLADAIRAELRSALLAKYGTLEAAAEELGMPYKTLRRHLTTTGKDRTARVSLDFVLEVSAQLERAAGIDFEEIYRRASLGLNVPGTTETQADYDRAARPSAKDRGEDLD